MLKKYARTDLAMEMSEHFMKNNNYIEGVEIYEESEHFDKIKMTYVDVLNEVGVKKIGREIGRYITIENIDVYDSCNYAKKELSESLRKSLVSLIDICQKGGMKLQDFKNKGEMKLQNFIKNENVLIVGLGNESITPDALGPRVINNIHVTRSVKSKKGIMAIAPGVMGQTGMEVKEIIYAIVQEIGAKLVIVVDALAARSIYRLNNTIQLTNTGISPGSGVGNNRAEISKKTIGVDVIAIGVPTVVDVFSLVGDVLEEYKKYCEGDMICDNQIIKEGMKNSFVTSKYIDLMINEMADIISDGINKAIQYE